MWTQRDSKDGQASAPRNEEGVGRQAVGRERWQGARVAALSRGCYSGEKGEPQLLAEGGRRQGALEGGLAERFCRGQGAARQGPEPPLPGL